MSRSYIAAIDDSGSSEVAVDWSGVPVPGDSLFSGLAGIVVRQDLLDEFEGRWNHLRSKIARRLDTEALPPIHMRWMWGKHAADPDRNPYGAASFREKQEWILEAVQLLQSLQRRPGQLGIVIAFQNRSEFSATQAKYFTDPQFLPEIRFLQQHNQKQHKKLYDRYHRQITSPIAYCLPEVLWKLNAAVAACGGTSVDVEFDHFAHARGIDTDEVLEATRHLAGFGLISSLNEIEVAYDASPLCQAADLIAWTTNRASTQRAQEGGPNDQPFIRIYDQVYRRLKTLDGGPFPQTAALPSTDAHYLCVPYALARASVADKFPEFADQHLITVEEFHRRHVATTPTDTGISVLTDRSRQRLGLTVGGLK